MNYPLITYALIAYNQETFVKEAVKAAFSQTYSPLEIVLSDDCSDDNTFAIMRRIASEYSGPHTLILNRNEERRSIGGHINKVMEMSNGELVVIAAADDISLSHRTEKIYRAWEKSNRKATSIHSGYVQIDENGKEINEIIRSDYPIGAEAIYEQIVDPIDYLKSLKPDVFGCTHAWSRNLFRLFGDLPQSVIHEDNALCFRSILSGKIIFINEKLVKYRVHKNNVYLKTHKRNFDTKNIKLEEYRILQDFRNREKMYESFIIDLERYVLNGGLERDLAEAIMDEACRIKKLFTIRREFMEASFLIRCKNLYSLFKLGASAREIKFLLPRLAPRDIFIRFKMFRNNILSKWQHADRI